MVVIAPLGAVMAVCVASEDNGGCRVRVVVRRGFLEKRTPKSFSNFDSGGKKQSVRSSEGSLVLGIKTWLYIVLHRSLVSFRSSIRVRICTVPFSSGWEQFTPTFPSSHRTLILENLNNRRVIPSSGVQHGCH